MEYIGLISVACALGTIVGIAIYIFGIARKSMMMKVAGAVVFVTSFGGLFMILSRYGYKPEKPAYSASAKRYKILKWESKEYLSDSTVAYQDYLRHWNHPPYLLLDGTNIKLGEGNNMLISRDFSQSKDSWNFSLSSTGEGPALMGTYAITFNDSTELHLEKDQGPLKEELWLVRVR